VEAAEADAAVVVVEAAEEVDKMKELTEAIIEELDNMNGEMRTTLAKRYSEGYNIKPYLLTILHRSSVNGGPKKQGFSTITYADYKIWMYHLPKEDKYFMFNEKEGEFFNWP
jgi:hypothetical protein